jgi:hypothetical protein
MDSQRRKRPKLERDQPVRNFSSLFTTTATSAAASSNGAGKTGAPSDAVAGAVNLGYRVIDAYMRQGQEAAQSFTGGGAPGQPPASEPLQQMTSRLMQYGMDFAGLWFEMWSKLGQGGFPEGAWPGFPGAPSPPPERAGHAASASRATSEAEPRDRVTVVVKSSLPVETALDLRQTRGKQLLIHALRPEGHEAPSIRSVEIETNAADGSLVVRVEIPADQAPGAYNCLIVDAGSNLPQGTLSVRVRPREG